MITKSFQQELDSRIAKYDLLRHPFYQAWSMGSLRREEIRQYACEYYPHVAAFPAYLSKFQKRLPTGFLANLINEHKLDEEGAKASDKRTHADLWLDFVEGMGGNRDHALKHEPISEIKELIETFNEIAANGEIAEVLAAFYAYESQVPRVAAEKERGLCELYGADHKTSYYFHLHKTFDTLHSRSWLDCLEAEVNGTIISQDKTVSGALDSAEKVAKALWKVLDGIEQQRLAAA
jgi:pyrroloquinoline-quinone synthase